MTDDGMKPMNVDVFLARPSPQNVSPTSTLPMIIVRSVVGMIL